MRKNSIPGFPVLAIRSNSSSTTSSISPSSEPEYEADDEMADYQQPSRPLTVSIPKSYVAGSACQRRPNLSEILANTAPPPYTLTAFMAHMSNNMCLELLEFTMDASRYRKHYSKMVNRTPGSPISPLSDECTYVKMLWKRLLDAYIAPNGPREVNLPSDVRDSLLSQSDSYVPPHPSTLDPAVSKVYELMEESVLLPFLNSFCPQSATTDSTYEHHEEPLQRSHTRSYDERALFQRSHQQHQPTQQRASAPSSLTSNFVHPRPFSHSRFASQPAASSSSTPPNRVTPGYGSGSDTLKDDSGSGSPSGPDDPRTPPNTPPMSDYSHYAAYYENGNTHSGTPSPRTSRGEHNGIAGATKDSWKRVSSKLWPRKRSGGALREEEQGAVEGGLF